MHQGPRWKGRERRALWEGGSGGRGQIQTKTQCWKAAERERPDQMVRNEEKTEMGERMSQERGRRGRDRARGMEGREVQKWREERGRVNRRGNQRDRA